MITKSKKPAPTPLLTKGATAPGSTVRDRRPAVAPARKPSTRRRIAPKRGVGRGRSVGVQAGIGIFETILHSVLSFGGAALAVSCVASLAGNVMLEASRRGTIEAETRLRSERAGAEDLKGRLATVASGDAVDRWAHEHGFIAAGEEPMPRTDPKMKKPGDRSLVARR